MTEPFDLVELCKAYPLCTPIMLTATEEEIERVNVYTRESLAAPTAPFNFRRQDLRDEEIRFMGVLPEVLLARLLEGTNDLSIYPNTGDTGIDIVCPLGTIGVRTITTIGHHLMVESKTFEKPRVPDIYCLMYFPYGVTKDRVAWIGWRQTERIRRTSSSYPGGNPHNPMSHTVLNEQLQNPQILLDRLATKKQTTMLDKIETTT